MTRTLSNFVDGQHVGAKDGRTAALVNPSTGEEFALTPISGEADVDLAMQAALHAFDRWSETTPAERSRALLRIADAVEARAE
jgi:betaine-aldehyde dehydrogenase